MLINDSEMFGTSEEEAPEFDHSEDTENGEADPSLVSTTLTSLQQERSKI